MKNYFAHTECILSATRQCNSTLLTRKTVCKHVLKLMLLLILTVPVFFTMFTSTNECTYLLTLIIIFVFNLSVLWTCLFINLFSAILLGIICLVLIWSCAGVDLAVAIVSYNYHDIMLHNYVCTQTMTHPFISSHWFIKKLIVVIHSQVCYLNTQIFFSLFWHICSEFQ